MKCGAKYVEEAKEAAAESEGGGGGDQENDFTDCLELMKKHKEISEALKVLQKAEKDMLALQTGKTKDKDADASGGTSKFTKAVAGFESQVTKALQTLTHLQTNYDNLHHILAH